MQADAPGLRRFIEMADDSVAHHPVQLVECIGSCENRVAESLRRTTR
jgi:hypothetical protein